MRVLHVHSGNLYGGVETLLTTLVRYRGRAPEVEHEFALSFDGRLSTELRALGGTVHPLGSVRISRPDLVLRARRSLRELLRGGGFGAVLCHSPWAQTIFGPVARAAGVPLVFWLHGAVQGRHWLERLARRVPPDLAICNSQFTAGMLPRLYPNAPAEVVYCPVPAGAVRLTAERRARVREEIGTAADAVVIVQVGRMERLKGQRDHLEALGRLRHIPGWVCWQVGGAQREEEVAFLGELRVLAEGLGIEDRVRFLGERGDVATLLAAADLYCQPNLAPEGFGITYVEALYAELPVVTSAIGGAKEIVDPSCGVLLPPSDSETLAAALIDLVRSPEERARLGAAGPARAKALCGVETQMPRLARALVSIASHRTE